VPELQQEQLRTDHDKDELSQSSLVALPTSMGKSILFCPITHGRDLDLEDHTRAA
jgi:hypothetical protein